MGVWVRCTCKAWEDFNKQLNACITYAGLTGGPRYPEGAVFRFCPWCGTELGREIIDNAVDKD